MIETVFVAFAFSWFVSWIKGTEWYGFDIFKHWSIYPIILTCFLHVYTVYLMFKGEYWFLEYATYIKTISLLFYFFLIVKYNLLDISVIKKINLIKDKVLLKWLTSPVIIGSLFLIIGSELNKIVMSYNNQKMPVFISNSWSTGYAKIDMFEKTLICNDFHTIGTLASNMIFLSDTWDFGYCSMSIGDIMVRIFAFIIIYYSIKQLDNHKIIIDKDK